ncbi:MAG: hypothetical protein CMJ31_13010 [Phycisphaerae bacterium]|nr:hypothetical protein [Phycisphaerae bacterium]
MHEPPQKNLRVVRYAEGFGFSAREWSAAIAAVDWRGGDPNRPTAEPLKDGRKASVWRATLRFGKGHKSREIDAILKVEALPTIWMRLKALFGWTKAHQQWRGAMTLGEGGVSAAEPLAILRGSKSETLVTRHAEGSTLLERLAGGLTVAEERALCDQIAAHLSRLYRAGMFHWDGKPSNLLLDPTAADGVRLLDTVLILQEDYIRPHDVGVLSQSLKDLYLEPAGCGLAPRRSLGLRLIRALGRADLHDGARETVRDLWANTEGEITDHGDPTPEDDPLTRPKL